MPDGPYTCTGKSAQMWPCWRAVPMEHSMPGTPSTSAARRLGSSRRSTRAAEGAGTASTPRCASSPHPSSQVLAWDRMAREEGAWPRRRSGTTCRPAVQDSRASRPGPRPKALAVPLGTGPAPSGLGKSPPALEIVFLSPPSSSKECTPPGSEAAAGAGAEVQCVGRPCPAWAGAGLPPPSGPTAPFLSAQNGFRPRRIQCLLGRAAFAGLQPWASPQPWAGHRRRGVQRSTNEVRISHVLVLFKYMYTGAYGVGLERECVVCERPKNGRARTQDCNRTRSRPKLSTAGPRRFP